MRYKTPRQHTVHAYTTNTTLPFFFSCERGDSSRRDLPSLSPSVRQTIHRTPNGLLFVPRKSSLRFSLHSLCLANVSSPLPYLNLLFLSLIQIYPYIYLLCTRVCILTDTDILVCTCAVLEWDLLESFVVFTILLIVFFFHFLLVCWESWRDATEWNFGIF